MRATVAELEGAYALAVVSEHDPERIILAREGWRENLSGHITVATGDGGMWCNPWGLWWEEVRASDTVRLDADGEIVDGDWDVTPAVFLHTELHRVRGDILLAQNPADPAPAEAAFLTAIAIAQQQKARSFELRAALALAKLHHSTGRPTDAHDILGPALEGFTSTPEFPQITEAMDFLAAVEAAG